MSLEPHTPTSEIDRLPLSDWTPRSQLRAASHSVPAPLVPCIDIHNHLGRWLSTDRSWMIRDVSALLRTLDECHVEAVVNLDGMSGAELEENLDRYDRAHPGRFFTFAQLDWTQLAAPNGVDLLLAELEASARAGARGLKVWKTLGLAFRDEQGLLVAPDDAPVVAVMRRAGELGLPVLIHTADPIAFFEPLDAHNERLDELRGTPDWWFGDTSRFPTFDDLLDAHARLILACPGTTFIGAHMGCAAEDLDRVERLLVAAPNYRVDIAGRMAELGRQPRRTARLISDFPDRVLFGTDIYPATADQYRLHYRFLETDDEGFAYALDADIPPQGRWDVAGLDLADDVVKRVYRDNAYAVLGLG